MPKLRPTPAQKGNEILLREIRHAKTDRDLTNKELGILLHCSVGTVKKRNNNPENFTLKELRMLKEKLHINLEGVL